MCFYFVETIFEKNRWQNSTVGVIYHFVSSNPPLVKCPTLSISLKMFQTVRQMGGCCGSSVKSNITPNLYLLTFTVNEKLNVSQWFSDLCALVLTGLHIGGRSMCDAVVSIMEERLLPLFGCYVGQRRLSVDGRD